MYGWLAGIKGTSYCIKMEQTSTNGTGCMHNIWIFFFFSSVRVSREFFAPFVDVLAEDEL